MNIKEKYTIIRIIYFALLSGITLVFLFTQDVNLETIEKIPKDQYIYLLIPIVAIIISQMFFEYNVKRLKTKDQNKFAEYQSAYLIRWAILEAAAFISIFYLQAPQINVIIIIAYFILIYPTFDKFKQVIGN